MDGSVGGENVLGRLYPSVYEVTQVKRGELVCP